MNEMLIGGIIIGLTIAFLVWFIFDNVRLKRKVEKIRRDIDYLITVHGELCNMIEETNIQGSCECNSPSKKEILHS